MFSPTHLDEERTTRNEVQERNHSQEDGTTATLPRPTSSTRSSAKEAQAGTSQTKMQRQSRERAKRVHDQMLNSSLRTFSRIS